MKQILKPPFTLESAKAIVQKAEDAWNTQNPNIVVSAYSEDSKWRSRDEFFKGHDDIKDFLKRKWTKELDYRLIKKLWTYTDNLISVSFEYEWRDAETGQWYRTHGNEYWEFNDEGLIKHCDTSANDIPILEKQRKYRL